MPTRLGVRLSPTFYPIRSGVAQRSHRSAPKFDSSKVIKADALRSTINAEVEKAGVLNAIGSVARLVSAETLQEIGKQLVALHRPATFSAAAPLAMADLGAVQAGDAEVVEKHAPRPVESDDGSEKLCCRACGSEALSIEFGKYGYYFKCTACGGNTPIKISCGHVGHRERLRKDARRFYRECADCKTRSLYFVNPVSFQTN